MNERVIAPHEPRRGGGASTAAPPADGQGNGHDGQAETRFGRRRAASAVVIADPDPIARCAIRAALDRRSGFALVGEAGSAHEAVRMAVSEKPDLVVIGVSVAGADCVAAIREIASALPGTRVVALSSDHDHEWSLPILRAGAWGCLSKTIEPASLRRVLRRVLDGEVVVTRALSTRLVDALRRQPESWRPVRSRLTSREWEVVDLLSAGASTRVIAERLGVAPTTVYTHVNRVLQKLGVHSRAELVVAARRLREAEGACDA